MSIIQVLFIIGIIIYIVVKQLNKAASVNQEQPPSYDNKEDVYIDAEEEDYVFNTPSPFAPASTQNYPANKKDKSISSPFGKSHKVKKTSSILPPPEHPPTAEEEQADFNIRSIEEVRRGIIWSEILNRKY
ncbi:MAG: hypothetical protein LUH22_06750 [Bacteroides sp.]|nr:hypothetical protein [Bacteroides sp.]